MFFISSIFLYLFFYFLFLLRSSQIFWHFILTLGFRVLGLLFWIWLGRDLLNWIRNFISICSDRNDNIAMLEGNLTKKESSMDCWENYYWRTEMIIIDHKEQGHFQDAIKFGAWTKLEILLSLEVSNLKGVKLIGLRVMRVE